MTWSRARTAGAPSGPSPRPGRDFRVVIVSRRPVKNRTQAQASVGLVKTMYERWPWIPVVVIGRIPDRARVAGQMLLSGARTVVQEPVTAAAFRAAVTRVVGRGGASGCPVPPPSLR